MSKRGRFHRTIYVVDGFAGPGRYDTGEEGSPVKLANFAQARFESGQGARLVCYFSEKLSARRNKLRECLAGYSPEVVRVFDGPFEKSLGAMLTSMEPNSPAVFFLDPFGVVGIEPDVIAPALQRPDTEVLINLNTPTLHRLSGSSDSPANEAPGKVRRLNRVLAFDPDDQNPEWLQFLHLDTRTWRTWAVNRYLDAIRLQSHSLKYGATYAVREKHGHAPKYYLVFASRSLAPFPLLTDAVCAEDDALAIQAVLEQKAPGQMMLFDPQPANDRAYSVQKISAEIEEFGRSQGWVTTQDILERFSHRNFGEFRQMHIRQLVRKMIRDGKGRFQEGSGKQNDKTPIIFT